MDFFNTFALRNGAVKYVIAIFLFYASPVFSQTPETDNFLKHDFNLVLDDGKHLLFKPGEWNGTDWLKFSAVIGGTALLTTIDEETQDLVYRNPDYSQSFPMKFGKWYGEPIITSAFAGGFYLYGIIAEDKDTRLIGLEVAESFAYSGLITTVLKVVIGRKRPYTHEGGYTFLPFTQPLAPGANEHFSLPSGHTTVAFSLATVLASHTDNLLLKTIAYTPAVLTAASRVYQDQHWVSDVFLGGAIGYFVGSYIVNRHNEKNNSSGDDVIIGFTSRGSISLIIPL